MKRLLKRALRLGFCGSPFYLCALWIVYARVGTDQFFVQHWRYADPVMTSRTHRWALWQRSLGSDERACLQAWLDAMGLSTPSATIFTPLFVLQDTMCFICGYKEWCNAVGLLLRLGIISTIPYCTEIRRERQGDVVFLHGKLETDVTLRLPFTNMEYNFMFPSIVSLQLEKTHCRWRQDYCIVAAEHRWFGGPIASQQSASLPSPWGDIADLSRRFTGFSMSCMMTLWDQLSDRLRVVK